MTPDSAEGNRRRPDDAAMRGILTQVRRLLDTLENPHGTLLDPVEVAKQLEAIRQRRIRVEPATEPKTVLVPWEDWSNLDTVPLAALGLRQSIYQRFQKLGIDTVGLVVRHGPGGLAASGVHLGPQLKPILIKRLAAHGLTLAQDNTGIPVAFLIDQTRLRLFGWWTAEANHAFANALGLVTLGDVERLTVEQIRQAPFGDYTTAGPDPIIRAMSADNPEDLAFVVGEINRALNSYRLEPIPAH